MRDLRWLLGILGILVFVWILTGIGREPNDIEMEVTVADSGLSGPVPIGEDATTPAEVSGPNTFLGDFLQLQFPQGNNPFASPPQQTIVTTPTNTNTAPEEPEQLTATEIEDELSKVEEEVAKIQETLRELEAEKDDSQYKDMIFLRKAAAASTDPDREYVLIEASNALEGRVNISGWTISSEITGKSITVPGAASLPRLGLSNSENAVNISSGERVYVSTGDSPIGFSFRVNKCSGFLSQFQSYNPGLPSRCPNPADDIEGRSIVNPSGYTDECVDFVKKIGRCKIVTGTLPLNLGGSCQEFIQDINYNSCVDDLKNDDDFYSDKQWRLYAERSSQLWKERNEVIKLIDSNGKLVDSIDY